MNRSLNNTCFDKSGQSELLRVYYSQIPQCQAKDAQRSSSLLKKKLVFWSTKRIFMHPVISSTDLNSAHLSALTTSAALKNDITSSTNMPFIYQREYFVIVLQCSAWVSGGNSLFNLELPFPAERACCMWHAFVCTKMWGLIAAEYSSISLTWVKFWQMTAFPDDVE